MIYGLYLSATGIMANSYKQDVLANNLANSETVGFKRDLAYFQERPTGRKERHRPDLGAILCSNTSAAGFWPPRRRSIIAGRPGNHWKQLDMGIEGNGYLCRRPATARRSSTRDGRSCSTPTTSWYWPTAGGQLVLDTDGKPIKLGAVGNFEIAKDGTDHARTAIAVARLGLFDVPDPSSSRRRAETLFDYPNLAKSLKPPIAQLHEADSSSGRMSIRPPS